MIQAEYLALILTGCGIIVSIIYYASVLRNTNKTQQMQLETRQTQLFMQLYQQLNTEESHKTIMELINFEIKDTEEYLQKYDSAVNPSHYGKRANIWYSFNTIGELLRMGIIELDLLTRLKLDLTVILMWEKYEDIIRATRLRESIPDVWEGFEYLYDEMKKFRDARGYPDIIGPKPTHSS
jgi:hypothetical protein